MEIYNVGNDTIENVCVQFGLFLVTEEEIYSVGEYGRAETYFVDKNRPPKASIWPRLKLKPNDKIDMTKRLINDISRTPYSYKNLDKDEIRETLGLNKLHKNLYNLSHIMKGSCIVFTELSYRKSNDFTPIIDSSFFKYEFHIVTFDNLELLIGGPKIIKRIKDYLNNGPEKYIKIAKNYCEIYHSSYYEFPPQLIKRIPRDTVKYFRYLNDWE